MALLRDVADVQRGDSYTAGRERWRTDPHAAATWPELALALYWYQMRTFGAERALRFRDALEAITVTDYRARPELAVALADDHSATVQRWAVEELARLPVRSGDTNDEEEDPALFPLRLLASAWSEANAEVLMRSFCQGGDRRRSAIVAVGRWGDKLYETVLVRMAAATRPSDPARRWLIQAALEMTARDLADDGRVGWGFGVGPDSWLVSRLIRGETPDVRPPLTCPAAS